VADLYLIFFGVGLLLFGGIVAYSYLQKQKQLVAPKEEYVDPLFAELEEQKSREKNLDGVATISEELEVSAPEVAAPSLDSSRNAETLNLENSDLRTTSAKTAPSLHQEAPSGTAVPADTESVEPTLEEVSEPEGPQQEEDFGKPKVDFDSSVMLTELVARIKNPEPIEQQGLLSLFRKHDFKFHRKVHIYGLNQLTDMWRDIEFELSAARFTELGVSIQLADRDGAMSQKELHDFQQMVLEFTNEYDAPFEFSMDIDEALRQARALDQIGRRYDSMAVLNVVPRSKSGFRMADIESCARDLMMSTDKNGIFMKTRGQKQNLSVLYRLACTDGSGHFGIETGAMTPVHDLVVYMNVPATEDPERVFQEMVKDANSMATWLEGKVVDRNGRVMTQRSYSMLMQQVSDIAFSMQQDGLVPGDAISKKLF